MSSLQVLPLPLRKPVTSTSASPMDNPDAIKEHSRNYDARRHEAIRNLPNSPLFSRKPLEGFLSYEQQMLLSVQRAKAIVKAYDLSIHDIAALTQPFWDLHGDAAMAMDTAAGTLVTIQINLAAGTLANHLKEHPSHRVVMRDILDFNVVAHYCLTEVAHGLDAINIETTATLQPDGGYLLHSPNPGASKIMPPTPPCGLPAVGIVFAKLIVDGKDQGTRPFLLSFNDGKDMMPGITATLMPPREGSPPVYHSMTTFNQVKLPAYALLGAKGTHAREKAAVRADYFATIWRTAVGALVLASGTIPAMERSAYICGKYSQRRTVGAAGGTGRVPILSFRTQQLPIMTTVVQSAVAKEFRKTAIENFRNSEVDYRVRHAWATVFKATIVHHAQTGTLVLASRCGAQGIFAHNEIISQHASILGLSIAEGDILGLCIRTASELLLGRYQMPDSTHPSSPLALHERGLFRENRELLQRIRNHRSDEFNRFILPRCESIIRAIGHRMAYDAAVDAGLDSRITELYLAVAIKLDSAWYVENMGMSREMQDMREDEALRAALPCLNDWLDAMNIEPYSQVPILTQSNWDAFRAGLPSFGDPNVTGLHSQTLPLAKL